MSSVREAKPQDLPRVWELVLALAQYEHLSHTVSGTQDDLRKWLFEEPAAHCLVCEVDDEIVGYSIYFTTFSTFRVRPGIWLEDVFVPPEHRSRGYGRALIEALLKIARQRGYSRVEWSVLDWNQPAIEFYKRLGADVLPDWRICRIAVGPSA